jgi:hypothetical protein
MSFFLGLLTALAVVAWGIYWYTTETRRLTVVHRRHLIKRLRVKEEEPPPLVPPETAEQLMQIEPEPPAPIQEAGLVEEPAEPVIAEQALVLSPDAQPSDSVMEAPEVVEPNGEPEAPQTSEPEATPRRRKRGKRRGQPQAQMIDEVGPPLEEQAGTPVEGEYFGHCVRCRERRALLDPTRATTKRGKPGVRGECAVCGGGIFVFIPEER